MKEIVSEWGTIIVALVALFGAVSTSIWGNKRSRINTEKQLEAARLNLTKQLESSEKNILLQVRANKELEVEKKKLELHQKYLFELKENLARFIKEADVINKSTKTINDFIAEGKGDLVRSVLEETRDNRTLITDIYYSIKISLDGSPKQLELERLLDKYLTYTCFREDLIGRADERQLEEIVSQIYHIVKTIIHENYNNPL